jgi:dihydroorotate dehydrogenase electron transfer subunit
MINQYQSKAEVLSSEQLTEDIFRLTLLSPEIAKTARPGQFVMLRVAENSFDPLLRRPFSIHQATEDGQLQLLYKVLGKTTRLMAGLQPGEVVDLLGPLGKGFTIAAQKNICLIGGGLGAAPLFFLTTWLLRAFKAEPLVLLGARHSAELQALSAAFQKLGLQVVKATDDGSEGHHGYIVDMMAESLPNRGGQPWRVYSCGPYPMLRAVSRFCHLKDHSCEVSLETMMACGISACLGCAIPRAGLDGYLHACKDGPVFNAAQVAWL